MITKWPTKRIIAGNGTNSHSNYILGPPGESVKMEVPTGITIYREDGRIVGMLLSTSGIIFSYFIIIYL